ncbi:MAG: protein translocase SEC61 complex subunit gamma [Euryarchaeota archaeon]|nr:protein translocase SEC61 complex subunit gamma [Euryarchaeota archaeon]
MGPVKPYACRMHPPLINSCRDFEWKSTRLSMEAVIIGGWVARKARGCTMSDEKTESRTFEDAVQDRQDWIEAQFRKISRGSWARIIRMARKPTPQEFKQTSIVCGIGLFVLGAIGFILLVIMDNFIPWLIHDVFGI